MMLNYLIIITREEMKSRKERIGIHAMACRKKKRKCNPCAE
jgi:hypothetical protein